MPVVYGEQQDVGVFAVVGCQNLLVHVSDIGDMHYGGVVDGFGVLADMVNNRVQFASSTVADAACNEIGSDDKSCEQNRKHD